MPRMLRAAGAAVAAVLVSLVLIPSPTSAAPTDADLAYRWAPIHYQDTAASRYYADYLSKVDYDGDWVTTNNRDNLTTDNIPLLTGAVYYSVAETETHWFIVYAFFHPDDWKVLSHHENDMEGVLVTVRRDGSEYGVLEAAVTVAHNDFYSYTPTGSPYVDGREDIAGTLLLQTYDGADHPTTFQEARGHGCYNWNGGEFPGGDGVVYYPSRGEGTVPTSGDDRDASYELIDIFAPGGLWERRNSNPPYASWGTFAGDNGRPDAAHAPWRWDDHDDGSDLQAGMLAMDPAYLVDQYFDGVGDFSLDYTRNTYRE